MNCPLIESTYDGGCGPGRSEAERISLGKLIQQVEGSKHMTLKDVTIVFTKTGEEMTLEEVKKMMEHHNNE